MIQFMIKADGNNETELARAALELHLLGQQVEERRATLSALQSELDEARKLLSDSQHLENLIEANQQLVLRILGQSEASPPAQPDLSVVQELRKANEELTTAALRAQQMQASAELAVIQQKSILAMVAHELRNPLTPISMIAERMTRLPSGDLPGMRALIEGKVQHISRMIEDLLDVSRASTGKLNLHLRDVDVVQVIREAAAACMPMMAAQNLNFSLDLPKCALLVKGDPIRLNQILNNVLTNAAKYTPEQGSVELKVAAYAGTVSIRVTDSGIGIPPQILPTIFDPFVRDVTAQAVNRSGLGLGLAVTRQLVEAHDGEVTCTSEGAGKGSEFIVTLPLLTYGASTYEW